MCVRAAEPNLISQKRDVFSVSRLSLLPQNKDETLRNTPAYKYAHSGRAETCLNVFKHGVSVQFITP